MAASRWGRWTRHTVAAGLLGLLGNASALAANPEPAPAMAPEAAASSPHAEDTATIRMHRLRHLEARLGVDPAELHAQCRYVSEVATAPPPRHVALTFDDGPEPVQTEYILEVLRRHQVQASFFMIGAQAQHHPDLVAKVLAEGHHLVGNHSWDHPNFHDIDGAAQMQQVDKTDAVLAQDMAPRLFRYPYGNSSCETNAYLHQRGYRIVGWHIDSCDWAFDHGGHVDAKEAAICGVLPQYQSDYVGHVLASLRAHNGGIVLMHEIHPNTLKLLDEIIRLALADGFVFDTIDAAGFAASLR